MTPLSTRTFGRTTKFQMLCHQLYELAHRLGPDAKLPTVVQLRDSMDVSMATLNSALKELETQNIIYRKHGVGIYVSSELHQKSVCLVCDPTFMSSANHSPFWDIMMVQARERASTHNEHFELHFTQPNGALNEPLQRGLARDIKEGKVDGIIGVGFEMNAVEWIEAQGVPFVSVFGPGSYNLGLDYECFFRLGIQQLQASGCQRLGLWMPVVPNRLRDLQLDLNADRCHEFVALMDEAGLITYPELIQLNQHLLPNLGDVTTQSHQEQGFLTAERVFGKSRSEWPDAILSTDDMMTHGALMAMQKLGVQAGVDVQVVSHANRGSSALIGREKELALLEYDPIEIVNTAFSMLESLMEGRKPLQEEVLVQPQLRRP